MTYAQLTREQRYQIHILRKAGHYQNFIAQEIGVHPSTITRELQRGRGRRGYRPKQADELAQIRKQKRYQPRIKASVWQLVERKSKLCLVKKVERNTAAEVEQAIAELLSPVADKVQTITSDNGREFAHHQAIATQLEADFYFAHPFASWQRGTNENTNGLVRQYFPKGSD